MDNITYKCALALDVFDTDLLCLALNKHYHTDLPTARELTRFYQLVAAHLYDGNCLGPGFF